jgi:hypothetical protein
LPSYGFAGLISGRFTLNALRFTLYASRFRRVQRRGAVGNEEGGFELRVWVGWAGHSPVHCRGNSPISASASGANGLPSAHLGEENHKCGDLSASIGAFPQECGDSSASIGAFPPECGDSSATIGAFPPTCGDSCATIAVLPFFCAGNSSQTPFSSLLAGGGPRLLWPSERKRSFTRRASYSQNWPRKKTRRSRPMRGRFRTP